MFADQSSKNVATDNRSNRRKSFQKTIPILACHLAEGMGRRQIGRQMHGALRTTATKHRFQYRIQKLKTVINLSGGDACISANAGHDVGKHRLQPLLIQDEILSGFFHCRLQNAHDGIFTLIALPALGAAEQVRIKPGTCRWRALAVQIVVPFFL